MKSDNPVYSNSSQPHNTSDKKSRRVIELLMAVFDFFFLFTIYLGTRFSTWNRCTRHDRAEPGNPLLFLKRDSLEN